MANPIPGLGALFTGVSANADTRGQGMPAGRVIPHAEGRAGLAGGTPAETGSRDNTSFEYSATPRYAETRHSPSGTRKGAMS